MYKKQDKITRFLPAGNSNVQIQIFVNDGDLNSKSYKPFVY